MVGFLIISTKPYAQYTDIINSNRPGKSMSAFSVGKTVIQAEPGIEHILTNVESTTGNVAKTTETVATAASRIASNPMAEVTAIKEAVLNMGKRGR